MRAWLTHWVICEPGFKSSTASEVEKESERPRDCFRGAGEALIRMDYPTQASAGAGCSGIIVAQTGVFGLVLPCNSRTIRRIVHSRILVGLVDLQHDAVTVLGAVSIDLSVNNFGGMDSLCLTPSGRMWV